MLEYVILEARRRPGNKTILTKRIAQHQRVKVGRTDAADLVLSDDPELSGVHFEVAVNDDQCLVTDQNSTNKTWKDGQQVTQSAIGDGETIRAGQTEFVFRLFSTDRKAASSEPFWSSESNRRDQPPVPASSTARGWASQPGGHDAPAPHGKPQTTSPPPPPPPEPRPPANGGAPHQPTGQPGRYRPPQKESPQSGESSDAGAEESINWNVFAEESAPPPPEVAEPREPEGGDEWPKDGPPLPGSIAAPETSSDVPSGDSLENDSVESKGSEPPRSDAESTQVMEGARASAKERVVIQITAVPVTEPQSRAIIERHGSPKTTIGRAAPSQLLCPTDRQMSNQHFEIELVGDECILRDLKSSNGTYLNGQRIHVAPLVHGDQIRAGQTLFEVSFE